MHDQPGQTTPTRGNPAEIFTAFLKLGLTAFGGPIAHLGYFRQEFVARRRWLDDAAYADLVALCQFLPGPASSQVGFALGLMRGGWLGALAAFFAFTLPSALILIAFAYALPILDGPLATGAVQGLKIVAVAIVAQAVWGMWRSLCPDLTRAMIALAALACLTLLPGLWSMLGAITLGGFAGALIIRPDGMQTGQAPLSMPVTPRQALWAVAGFAAIIGLLPLLAGLSPVLAMIEGFARAGALVFGGGHVVLPLLEAETVARGWVGTDEFLAGYGAAQAVPGPLFTFAAYLGAVQSPDPNGLIGAAIALLAVFAPGFLILIAVLPHWAKLRALPMAQAVMRGANAAVVGILAAALYTPVFTGAIGDWRGLALALVCFALLMQWKAPAWAVVVLAASTGAVMALIP